MVIKKRVFSKRSLANLKGVHPDLVKVVERALQLSELDFTVTEGLRTKEKQLEYYNKGASRTTSGSRHLAGSQDGFGHAVDVMAYGVDNVWDFDHYYKIADGFRKAAIELGIPIRWGGAWHYRLNEEERSAKSLTEAYTRTQRETGKSVFLDGVHFELPNSAEYLQ